MPLANAFNESSGMMYNFGIFMPAAIQRFSSRLYTLLLLARSNGLAPVASLIITACPIHAIRNQMAVPASTNGMMRIKDSLEDVVSPSAANRIVA